jgi:hypothetical protein
MAEPLVCPGCVRARRVRVPRMVLGVLLVLSILAGFAMMGVLFLLAIDPFAGESGPIPWGMNVVIALVPWLSAVGLTFGYRWLGKQQLRSAPAPPVAERLYREAQLDPRCPQHRG